MNKYLINIFCEISEGGQHARRRGRLHRPRGPPCVPSPVPYHLYRQHPVPYPIQHPVPYALQHSVPYTIYSHHPVPYSAKGERHHVRVCRNPNKRARLSKPSPRERLSKPEKVIPLPNTVQALCRNCPPRTRPSA